MIDAQPLVIGLGDHLQRAVRVAERAGGVRSAAGDDIDLAALRPEGLGHRFEFGVHVQARRPLLGRRAVEDIQEHVAVGVVVRILRPRPVLEQDVAVHAEARGEGGRLSRVVGLRGALGHDHVGALLDRLGHQELELAGLVAAGRKSRAVVALDP